MEHVVFSAAEGGTGEEFRRVSSLEEAVRVVEHLRNDLGIADASVFALTPVPLEFKAYYRVELPGVKMPVAESRLDTSELATEPSSDDESPAAEPANVALKDPEFADQELTDTDYLPDLSTSDPSVPALLPAVDAIPPSRQDADAERSLGYYAR